MSRVAHVTGANTTNTFDIAAGHFDQRQASTIPTRSTPHTDRKTTRGTRRAAEAKPIRNCCWRSEGVRLTGALRRAASHTHGDRCCWVPIHATTAPGQTAPNSQEFAFDSTFRRLLHSHLRETRDRRTDCTERSLDKTASPGNGGHTKGMFDGRRGYTTQVSTRTHTTTIISRQM